jgi:hypothetical protein
MKPITFVTLGLTLTPEVEAIGMGQPAHGLTLKDLCLLHARDAHPGTPRRLVGDVLRACAPISAQFVVKLSQLK